MCGLIITFLQQNLKWKQDTIHFFLLPIPCKTVSPPHKMSKENNPFTYFFPSQWQSYQTETIQKLAGWCILSSISNYLLLAYKDPIYAISDFGFFIPISINFIFLKIWISQEWDIYISSTNVIVSYLYRQKAGVCSNPICRKSLLHRTVILCAVLFTIYFIMAPITLSFL